jgi:hypothetical protein
MLSPKHEHHALAMIANILDDCVGECFPAFICMRICLVFLHTVYVAVAILNLDLTTVYRTKIYGCFELEPCAEGSDVNSAVLLQL